MRPVFADPKTDFVFKRIFGSEVHKPLLIELLNALLPSSTCLSRS
jgi:PD-(D/E)XK nuclease family transposase